MTPRETSAFAYAKFDRRRPVLPRGPSGLPREATDQQLEEARPHPRTRRRTWSDRSRKKRTFLPSRHRASSPQGRRSRLPLGAEIDGTQRSHDGLEAGRHIHVAF
jgi:hypothetical protein